MLNEIDGIANRRLDQPDRSAVIRELLPKHLRHVERNSNATQLRQNPLSRRPR
jgi:hypothetical protein